jgi:hypothetical protein
MAGVEVRDAIGHTGEPVHRVVELDARHPEDVADALAHQLLGERLAAGHRHEVIW